MNKLKVVVSFEVFDSYDLSAVFSGKMVSRLFTKPEQVIVEFTDGTTLTLSESGHCGSIRLEVEGVCEEKEEQAA